MRRHVTARVWWTFAVLTFFPASLASAQPSAVSWIEFFLPGMNASSLCVGNQSGACEWAVSPDETIRISIAGYPVHDAYFYQSPGIRDALGNVYFSGRELNVPCGDGTVTNAVTLRRLTANGIFEPVLRFVLPCTGNSYMEVLGLALDSVQGTALVAVEADEDITSGPPFWEIIELHGLPTVLDVVPEGPPGPEGPQGPPGQDADMSRVVALENLVAAQQQQLDSLVPTLLDQLAERVTITSPRDGDTLDCMPGAAPTTITWFPGPYDRFRVFISWDPDFAQGDYVTSGRTLLTGTRWTVPEGRWGNACSHADPGLYVRVMGLDRDLPRGEPGRRAFSEIVEMHVAW